MAGRSLFDSEEKEDSITYRPYINTGGPLDVMNGKFIPNVDGTMTLSGGLGPTTATIARGNRFKSAWQHGNMIGAMECWPDAEGIVLETEFGSIDADRMTGMAKRFRNDPVKRAAHLEYLKGKLTIYDHSTETAETLEAFFEHMARIRDYKLKNIKGWEVETEIMDRRTMKPYRMLFPTFVGIDSWSEALVKQVSNRVEEFDGDTEMKEKRTIHLEEGWNKAERMRALPKLCIQGGIYCLLTAHLGDKYSLDGKPNSKDLAHMKQDEMAKGVGPKFNFLMSTIVQINTASALIGADKSQPEFPSKSSFVSATDLMELMIVVIRSKNAPSGMQAPIVASQTLGVQSGLSYYQALRKGKYYGLGSPNKVRNPFLGDMDIGRTKIFDLTDDPRVNRALELTFQLFYIQNNWNLVNLPQCFSMPVDKLVEMLHQNSYASDDILNSRGWWTYTDAGIDQPHLSLYDALLIATGEYKPKFFAVSQPLKKAA